MVVNQMVSTSILPLPLEILLLISSTCDYAAALALSMTCQRLHDATTPRQQYGMADLLQIELWPCYDGAAPFEGPMLQPRAGRDYFACYSCLRIRSATKFSNVMMKGPKGKRSIEDNGFYSRQFRYCIDCGIQLQKYKPGTRLIYGGAPILSMGQELGGGEGLVCQSCRSFNRLPSSVQPQTRNCLSCLRLSSY